MFIGTCINGPINHNLAHYVCESHNLAQNSTNHLDEIQSITPQSLLLFPNFNLGVLAEDLIGHKVIIISYYDNLIK
jgi:hypothetical protein